MAQAVLVVTPEDPVVLGTADQDTVAALDSALDRVDQAALAAVDPEVPDSVVPEDPDLEVDTDTAVLGTTVDSDKAVGLAVPAIPVKCGSSLEAFDCSRSAHLMCSVVIFCL